MTAPGVVLMQWTGEAFVPANNYWAKAADKTFVAGQRYPLVVQEDRSSAAHAHYFACVAEAWKNLPETSADQFPTVDHLRKFALIQCGFRDERSLVCASRAEALRVAAFVRPVDGYAIVTVSGATVIVLTARSQKYRAMGKQEFAESKQAVLGYLAGMIGVTPEALAKTAMEAA